MSIRRLGGDEDEDPLVGVANLFDLGIVFALGLMLAATGQLMLAKPLDKGNMFTEGGAPTTDVQKLERFRASDEPLSGQGERLGVAYRLASGEVVYVPEPSDKMTPKETEGVPP